LQARLCIAEQDGAALAQQGQTDKAHGEVSGTVVPNPSFTVARGRSLKRDERTPKFQPNAVVAPFHPKAMPLILGTREEVALWLTVPAKDAQALQRPLPDDVLRNVARGKKEDGLVGD
jgi:hypothetical protein